MSNEKISRQSNVDEMNKLLSYCLHLDNASPTLLSKTHRCLYVEIGAMKCHSTNKHLQFYYIS